jgi:hypothetical protein
MTRKSRGANSFPSSFQRGQGRLQSRASSVYTVEAADNHITASFAHGFLLADAFVIELNCSCNERT